MKISYRNYPILEKLHKNNIESLNVFKTDVAGWENIEKFFRENWYICNNSFVSEINVISKPFCDASVKAGAKMVQLWGDILLEDLSDFDVKGCFVWGDIVYMIDYEVRKGVQNHELSFYMFDNRGVPLMCFIDSKKRSIFQSGWISECFRNEAESNPEAWIYKELAKIVIFKMFKTYAEVETKIIPANSRIKDISCKYVNDTKLQLTYLDSKWFTNLVKSDGFNVRGHFRLQPKKKKGEWTKELIWIEEFKKTGYTAPARKLSNLGI